MSGVMFFGLILILGADSVDPSSRDEGQDRALVNQQIR
jgi:hypothetical protein